MNVSIATFKNIVKEFGRLAKYPSGGEIIIKTNYDARYNVIYTVEYSSLAFDKAHKLHSFVKSKPADLRRLKLPANSQVVLTTDIEQLTLRDIDTHHTKEFKTLKLIPEDIATDYRPKIIRHSPAEIVEGNYTYRIATGVDTEGLKSQAVCIVARNDEAIYDYLDKGFYAMCLKEAKTDPQWIVSNMYDINTAYVFLMCKLQPKLTEMLQNGCFINSNDAEMLRLRMFKKLAPSVKETYTRTATAIESDYRKNTTMLVVGKLMAGDVEKTTINNITLTKTTATYERISIEADDLLDVLCSKLNFNGEFDIYTISETYAAHIERKLIPSDKEEAQPADEAVNNVNEEDEAAATKSELPTFKINGIDITAAISTTRQRYINNVRINKGEIAQAIHRASCHHNAAEYKLFLKSISKMSIKWHDVIANGIQVKIHSPMSRDEYSSGTPSPKAPAIKFLIDKQEGCVKIKVSETRAVKVALGRLIRRIDTANKKTDDRNFHTRPGLGHYGRWGRRNAEWCAEQLVDILIDCCTFKLKVVQEDKTVKEVETTLITKEDIVSLLSIAQEGKRLALERSRKFLESAVNLTKAEIVEFMGRKAYKVQGSLRTYAVVIENAKVYDYDTKQYRCIVNDQHYAGAGYDDIAARLLALKNDSMMQEQIRTLNGSAQPFAENAHNYTPERSVEDKVASLVATKFKE